MCPLPAGEMDIETGWPVWCETSTGMKRRCIEGGLRYTGLEYENFEEHGRTGGNDGGTTQLTMH
jgi:hypothetical protein